MSQSNAIMLRRKDEFATPFEEFLAHLLIKRHAPVRTMAGSAEWSDIPYDRVVADGLWLILLKTAKKINIGVQTETDVVRDIGPRVSRVLNAGLVLSYPSMGEAARVFRRRVASAEAIALRHAPQTLSELWSKASARFFADALKQAAHVRLAIWNEAAALVQGKTKERLLGWHASRDQIAGWLNVLDLNQGGRERSFSGHARSWLEQTRRKVRMERLLARVPMRINTVSSEVILPKTVDYILGDEEMNAEMPGQIESMWVRTQILLAAAEAPDADYVTGETYLQGIRALASLSDDQAIERFRTRVRLRSSWFADADPEIFDLYVRDCLIAVRAYTNVLDLKTAHEVLIELPPVSAQLNAAYVLEYAADNAPETFGHHDFEPTEEDYRNLLPWDAVTPSMFRRMVSYQAVPLSILAEGIARMPEANRQAAAEVLFQRAGRELKEGREPTAFLRVLFEIEGVTFEKHILIEHLDLLPQARLRSLLPELVKDAKRGARRDGETCCLIARAALKLPPPEAAEALGNPQAREYVAESIIGTRINVLSMFELYDADDVALLSRLRRHIGADLWHRLVLGAALLQMRVICHISEDEVCRIDPEIDHRLATWEELADADLISAKKERLNYPFVLHEFLLVGREEARRLLKTYRERDIHNWLFEVRLKEASWRGYERMKRTYARMIREANAPPKNPRSKKAKRKKRTR